jgi:hypothetical protein
MISAIESSAAAGPSAFPPVAAWVTVAASNASDKMVVFAPATRVQRAATYRNCFSKPFIPTPLMISVRSSALIQSHLFEYAHLRPGTRTLSRMPGTQEMGIQRRPAC